MDGVAHVFLTFSHDTIIVPLILFGYIWGRRDIFYDAICLLLFSMIFNAALKVTFQVPLSPFLEKDGFAFPSGHMQSSFILYGWLALKIQNNWIRLLIALLLFGIGISLVSCGYHSYCDIFGSIFFALLLMITYWLGISKNEKIYGQKAFQHP